MCFGAWRPCGKKPNEISAICRSRCLSVAGVASGAAARPAMTSEALARRLAESSSQVATLGRLAELFELDEAPERIDSQ